MQTIKSIVLSLTTLLLAALFLLTVGLSLAQTRVTSAPRLKIRIEPVEVIEGPNTVTDNPFNTVTGVSSLLAYVANSTTRGWVGGSLETLRPIEDPVLEYGTDFDSCGAWLNNAWRDGTVIRGWYHAESPNPQCDSNAWLTKKSVAYAESNDGGFSFTKPDYSSNQVIVAPLAYTELITADEGDHHVIQMGDYLYMYFLAGRNWQIHLAHSHISDGGRPGTWQKYFNGTFSQPGVHGESSPIAVWDDLATSWVSFNTYLNRYVGFSGKWQRGFGLSLSADGMNWAALPYLIIPTEGEWLNRDADSKELAAYPSLISTYGDSNHIDDTFWLYYMYLNPGKGFDDRYLLRRKIHLEWTDSDMQIELVPHIALVQYRNNDDTWATTTNTYTNYESVETVGYLFTDQIPNSKPVYDCYIDFWDDHMLTIDDPTCGNATYLRRVGWISTIPFDNSVQVYRCFDEARTNHFVSTDPNCEGQDTEWSMGYLAVKSPLPPNEYVALSSYYRPAQQDNWTTTTKPPVAYQFEARLGYLLAAQKPNSNPIYDCYIEVWKDHMLAPNDPTCGGVQNLGLIGWIATEPFSNAVALYRCFDQGATNHFVSLDPACNGQQLEWRIGYVAIEPFTGYQTYLPLIQK